VRTVIEVRDDGDSVSGKDGSTLSRKMTIEKCLLRGRIIFP
jgi:hypothetical protein